MRALPRRGLALLLGLGVVALTGVARAESSVVGRSERNRFGRWEWMPFPRLATGIGTSTHMFSIGSITSTPAKGQPASSALPLPSELLEGNTVVAQTIDLRPVIVFLGGPIYLAGVIQIGPGFRRGSTSDGSYSASSAGLFFEGGLLPGVAVPLGESGVTAKLETLLGGRLLAISGYRNDGSERSFTATSTSWVVQPRVALDVWTSPFVTVGAFAGSNLVRQGDHVFGLSVAAHVSPFDASP
jgi:hypothetical protein